MRCAVLLIYLGAAVLLSIHFLIGLPKSAKDDVISPEVSKEAEDAKLLSAILNNTDRPIVAQSSMAKTIEVQQFASTEGQPITRVTIVD